MVNLSFIADNPIWLVLIAVWILPWKGAALWRAANRKQKKWFVVLLVVNTFAVLEILYIFIFSKRGQKNVPTEIGTQSTKQQQQQQGGKYLAGLGKQGCGP